MPMFCSGTCSALIDFSLLRSRTAFIAHDSHEYKNSTNLSFGKSAPGTGPGVQIGEVFIFLKPHVFIFKSVFQDLIILLHA